MTSIEAIGQEFKIDNTHLIKPGVGETTRVFAQKSPLENTHSAWISGEAQAHFTTRRGQRRARH